MNVFQPPEYAPIRFGADRRPSVFLAGSIDMGAAVDWQAQVIAALSDLDVDVYNPRRDDWDSTWAQDISNAPFRTQVEWELDHLQAADVIAFYFDANGKAPITLMELGLHAAEGRGIVYCPKAYWRSGNVQVLCKRYGISLTEDSVEDFIVRLRRKIIDAGF